jgi:hypothetical protein
MREAIPPRIQPSIRLHGLKLNTITSDLQAYVYTTSYDSVTDLINMLYFTNYFIGFTSVEF